LRFKRSNEVESDEDIIENKRRKTGEVKLKKRKQEKQESDSHAKKKRRLISIDKAYENLKRKRQNKEFSPNKRIIIEEITSPDSESEEERVN
jgi:hypothetical protein